MAKSGKPKSSPPRPKPSSPPPAVAVPIAPSRTISPIVWIAVAGVVIVAALVVFLLIPREPPVHGYEVVKAYPHDPEAYTQGLVFEDGVLYESTGQKGESSLRRVELETGKVQLREGVSSRYFAEGITIWKDKIIQLTWQDRLGLVYDKATLKRLPGEAGEFRYEGEGWGLTHDGSRLIRSDGTDTLHFHDPKTYAETGTLKVTQAGRPLRDLNELESIEGEIWANLFTKDLIARIDPQTGKVKSLVDLAGIMPKSELEPGEVLNGIAYDAAARRIFVTGKNWPKLFEIRVKE